MILYVSYRFETDIGAAIHLDILKELYGEENIFVVDLRMNDAYEVERYLALGKYRGKLARIRQWIQGNTMYISNTGISRICGVIAQYDIHEVYIEDSIFGNLAKAIKSRFPKVSIIAFYHDIAADLYRQRRKHNRKLVNQIESSVAIYQERIQQKYTDRNIVFSKREAALYQKYYGSTPEEIIPLSAYIPKHTPEYMASVPEKTEQKHLLFVGTRYWPNMVGIRWFCSQVLPGLQDNIVVDIVGRGTEMLREELKDSRVIVHGGVDDLAQFYRTADIVVVPLFDGGGMKMKTAEAISFGKCIVGTEEGLTGFWDGMDDAVRGKSVFLCNTAQQWCETINMLCRESVSKFNMPLYRTFLEQYSYDATKKMMTRLLDQR